MVDKQPYFKFYPDDWLSDEKLRACSSAARGLWIDMLALMHKNDRRGFLELSGNPVTAELLGRMTGRSTDEVTQQLTELLTTGVASAQTTGVIFSRRMVRDERKRQLCSESGKKGATLKGHAKGHAQGGLQPNVDMGNGPGFGERVPGKTKDCPQGAQTWEAWLTVEWIFYYAGTANTERDSYRLDKFFASMIQHIRPEEIRDAIRDKAREKTEPTWEFAKRWGRSWHSVRSVARISAQPGKYAKVGKRLGETRVTTAPNEGPPAESGAKS